MGNRIRLEQVLINLFQNALEALDGRDDAKVQVSVEETADGVTLAVSDNGPGIPPAILKSLFTPFNTSKEKGLGLGLVISKDIVADYGGRIEVSSGNSGTRFTVHLCQGSMMDHDAAPVILIDDDSDLLQGHRADAGACRLFGVGLCGGGRGAGRARRRFRRRGGVRHPHARDRRPAAFRPRPAARCRHSGHPRHRAWRHRDGGQGDQGRRLRLHHQALRRRPAGAERAAGGGKAPPGDGEPGLARGRRSRRRTACR